MSTLLSRATYVYHTGHILYAFLLRSHILLHPGLTGHSLVSARAHKNAIEPIPRAALLGQ